MAIVQIQAVLGADVDAGAPSIALAVPEAAAAEAATRRVRVDPRHVSANLAVVLRRAALQRGQRPLDRRVVVADQRRPQTDGTAAAKVEPDEVAKGDDRNRRHEDAHHYEAPSGHARPPAPARLLPSARCPSIGGWTGSPRSRRMCWESEYSSCSSASTSADATSSVRIAGAWCRAPSGDGCAVARAGGSTIAACSCADSSPHRKGPPMAQKRAKAVKSNRPARPRDLALGTGRSRGVKGGRSPIQLNPGPDILKTPAPAGPVPTPYPN